MSAAKDVSCQKPKVRPDAWILTVTTWKGKESWPPEARLLLHLGRKMYPGCWKPEYTYRCYSSEQNNILTIRSQGISVSVTVLKRKVSLLSEARVYLQLKHLSVSSYSYSLAFYIQDTFSQRCNTYRNSLNSYSQDSFPSRGITLTLGIPCNPLAFSKGLR